MPTRSARRRLVLRADEPVHRGGPAGRGEGRAVHRRHPGFRGHPGTRHRRAGVGRRRPVHLRGCKPARLPGAAGQRGALAVGAGVGEHAGEQQGGRGVRHRGLPDEARGLRLRGVARRVEAGAILPHVDGYLAPDAFPLSLSILLVAGVTVGGTARLAGPVVGIALLEVLPHLVSGFDRYSLLIYGSILIVGMLFVRRGILPTAADAWLNLFLRATRRVDPPTTRVDAVGAGTDPAGSADAHCVRCGQTLQRSTHVARRVSSRPARPDHGGDRTERLGQDHSAERDPRLLPAGCRTGQPGREADIRAQALPGRAGRAGPDVPDAHRSGGAHVPGERHERGLHHPAGHPGRGAAARSPRPAGLARRRARRRPAAALRRSGRAYPRRWRFADRRPAAAARHRPRARPAPVGVAARRTGRRPGRHGGRSAGRGSAPASGRWPRGRACGTQHQSGHGRGRPRHRTRPGTGDRERGSRDGSTGSRGPGLLPGWADSCLTRLPSSRCRGCGPGTAISRSSTACPCRWRPASSSLCSAPTVPAKARCCGSVPVSCGRAAARLSLAARIWPPQAPHRVAKLGLGYASEGRRVFERESVAANLELGAYPLGGRNRRTAHLFDRVYELFPVLARKAGMMASTLSGGERQMLAIGAGPDGRPAAGGARRAVRGSGTEADRRCVRGAGPAARRGPVHAVGRADRRAVAGPV